MGEVMDEGPRPDNAEPSGTLESSLRIGCGALIGIFIGAVLGSVVLVEFGSSAALAAGVVTTAVFFCAFLGWRHGDRFFLSIARGIRALWWWL